MVKSLAMNIYLQVSVQLATVTNKSGLDANLSLAFFVAVCTLISLLSRKNTRPVVLTVVRFSLTIALALQPVCAYAAFLPPVNILKMQFPLAFLVKLFWVVTLGTVAFQLAR